MPSLASQPLVLNPLAFTARQADIPSVSERAGRPAILMHWVQQSRKARMVKAKQEENERFGFKQMYFVLIIYTFTNDGFL